MRERLRARARPTDMGRSWTLAVALVLVTVSCGTGDDGSGPPTSSPSTSDTTVAPVTTVPSPPTLVPSPTVGPVELIDPQPAPEDLDEAIRQAKTDLAARTGVDPGEIAVTVSGKVTWNDGSLGCPEPGKMYTQSLVPGWRIVLSVAEGDHAYHAAQGGTLFYCPSPSDGSSPDL